MSPSLRQSTRMSFKKPKSEKNRKKIPAVYDEKKLAKWTKKYNKLIKN